MAKVQITELPVHVYTCLTDPSRSPIAIVGKLPMVFRGETPMKAKKAASDWCREQVEKEARAEEGKAKRTEAARRARKVEE